MHRLVAAVALAALPAAAQEEMRWGPVAETLGVGSGICRDGEDIVCAVVLCEEEGTTLGVLGTGHGGVEPPFLATIDIDGEQEEREMQGRIVMDDFLHVRTPVAPDEPLWRRLRAGSRLKIAAAADGEPLDFTLRGSAAELGRVQSDCR